MRLPEEVSKKREVTSSPVAEGSQTAMLPTPPVPVGILLVEQQVSLSL